MGKMFLMCGLSGAGKTTFAKKFAEDNGYIYLGIDEFYAKYCEHQRVSTENAYKDNDASFRVWLEFFNEIHFYKRAGSDVVIDTNAPTFVKRVQFIDWFPTFDEHNLIYIEADRDLRRCNNAARDRVVPDDEIERMEREFEPPAIDWFEGYEDDENKHMFIISPYHKEYKYWDNVKFLKNKNNLLKEMEFYR